MVTVSILFNPGMSKMRGWRGFGRKAGSAAGPARAVWFRRGRAGCAEGRGSAGCWEPLQSPRRRHLVSLNPLQ